MASAQTMFRTLRPVSIFRYHRAFSRRTFMNIPGTENQILTETRILPYSSSSLYKIIADVDSYSVFLPYCNASRITSWSSPDDNDTRWPSQADLTVGWGAYSETFTSKIYCVPGSIVEAQSGSASPPTTIPHISLSHYGSSVESPPVENSVFESLLTTWTVKPFHYMPPTGHPQTDKVTHAPRDQTEVHMKIVYRFKNPMYGTLTQAVTPKIAAAMVDAFEKRMRMLLDGPGAGVTKESLGQAMGRKINV